MNATTLPDLNTPVRDIARPGFVRLETTETIAQALSRLREENLGERIAYFYATDPDGRLAGVVPTRRLLLSPATTPVADVMVHPVIAVNESEPFRNALRMFTDRRLLALPVVDDSGRLTGVLDVYTFAQSLIDLERRESTEEVFQLAGIHVEQERTRSTMWVFGKRLPWLLFNVASGLLAAFISNLYGDLLRSVVVLTFFIPLVLALAESVAMQSVTMSLSRLQIAPAPRSGGMFREVRVGLMLGLSSGAIAGFIGMGWLGLYHVSGVVAAGVAIAATLGAVFGFLVPRLVHYWKLDPMIASGPVALALTDIAALACYFGLSAAVLA